MFPHLRSRIIAAALLAGGAWLLAGCDIEIRDPALPTFTTRLAVPLGHQELTVAELIDDQDFLAAGADSVLAFSVDGDSTEVALDLDLSVDLAGAAAGTAIGPIALDDAPPLGFGFTLDEIYPAASLLPPGPVVVPAFDFVLDGEPADVQDIRSAAVQTGRLRLTLRNDLPVPLSGPDEPERITVSVVDPADGTVLAAAVFAAAVAPGETAEAEADLAGVTLPGTVAVSLSGGSPGGAVPGGLDPADGLSVDVGLADLTVSAATAVVGALSFADAGALALPDDLGILSARLASGALDVSVRNDLPLACDAVLSFPEITLADGSPLALPLALAPGGSTDAHVDLADAVVAAPGAAPLTSLRWEVDVTTPGSGGAYVTLDASDRLEAVVAPSTLALAEVTGLIPEETFALDPVEETLDLPDELDGLQLAAATLTITVLNDTGVSGTLDATLTGENAAGAVTTLSALARIEGDAGKSTRTLIVLDETNSSIAEFLSSLPETVRLDGEIRIGGDGEVGTVRPGDRAGLDWRLDAPLRLTVSESVIEPAAEPLDLDDDVREHLEEHLIRAELIAEIANRFPFGAELSLQVGPDSTAATTSPELVVGPILVEPGLLDPEGGWTVAPVTSPVTVGLDAAGVRALTRPGAYLAVVARIPGSDGQVITVRVGDRLDVRAALSAEVLIQE